MDLLALWTRYQKHVCRIPELDLSLDISRMNFGDSFLADKEAAIQNAYAAMDKLEGGSIANPDEGRMVGHYWLRAPEIVLRAPELVQKDEIKKQIEDTLAAIKAFTRKVHSGTVRPPATPRFTHVLSVGIGGSALGPMFVADALGQPGQDKMEVHFVDNTDPDGIERTLARLEGKLSSTLVIVTSKSGGTPETYNGMQLVSNAYCRAGLMLRHHAVAITKKDSDLDKFALAKHWLARFPMFDWVGGRTSELSAVGLLPAALQGIDIDGLLAGAAVCDEATRSKETAKNPAALLALMWLYGRGGDGNRSMVVLPYKDRLLLFSRYLQQLVMESLGKKLDLNGKEVFQGIAVYGNKGSTDQHAYVQQLRDGVNNFFVTFIRVLEEGGTGAEVKDGFTAGDYLNGFLLGTREALSEGGRESITITVRRVDARTVGALIALFERAVGFYATMVNINAYNQPGVEAGKDAATAILKTEAELRAQLSATPQSAEQLAGALGTPDLVERVHHVLEHLAANGKAKKNSDGAYTA